MICPQGGLPQALLTAEPDGSKRCLRPNSGNWRAGDGVCFQAEEFTESPNDFKRRRDSVRGRLCARRITPED
jgi:hypothetical protein